MADLPPSQWFAVLDTDGNLSSSGTVVSDDLPDGFEVVPVDGDPAGRPWDPTARAWGQIPEVQQPPAAVAVDTDAIARIADDSSLTAAAKVAAIRALLGS